MRFRFWIGLAAVLAIGVGAVIAAALVYSDDHADFHEMQREQARNSARQAENAVALAVGQLASVAAFLKTEDTVNAHQFDVIGKPLIEEGELAATAFIERVPGHRRDSFEQSTGKPIFDRFGAVTNARPRDGNLRIAPERDVYYPVRFGVTPFGTAAPIGFDLGADAERGRFLRRAGESGMPVATPPVRLLFGGNGINVYHPVYRDGAPTATIAQRRDALIGFVAGAFRVADLADVAFAAVSEPLDVQVRIDRRLAVGGKVDVDDAALARIDVVDRDWVLVVDAPGGPDLSLPILLAAVGVALSALLGALVFVWSRNERMRQLEKEASQDPLTGLKNRRRFDEELRAAMARGRRDRTTGAVLMVDLDDFKSVNDSHGHAAGDRLIVEVADLLRRRTRESDVLARLGGDEFAIVLPRCSRQEARIVAESIAAAVREHQPAAEELEPITASVGIATFGEDPRLSPATIVSEADTAMYAAKDSGRDGVRLFDASAIRDDAPGR